MKLSADSIWGISSEHKSILKAAEGFLQTHNYVQEHMIKDKARVKVNFGQYLTDLITLKFITQNGRTFKLSIPGYDCLAINSLRKLGLRMVGGQIGIGKESDILLANYEGKDACLKIHRLGRHCFTKIQERGLKNEENWFLANKESARKEADFMKLFKDSDNPEINKRIPQFYACNRHIIVMELLENYDTLYKVTVNNPEIISLRMLQFLKDLWDMGYAHGDFNEFNIMVNDDDIKVIDFPQCVPVTDEKALFYLKRDIECIHSFFWKKNFYEVDDSMFEEIYKNYQIKIEVHKSGLELRKNN